MASEKVFVKTSVKERKMSFQILSVSLIMFETDSVLVIALTWLWR